ncbi:MAG: DUF4032 domain-containing protein [Gaiellaceae bacterium]
MRIQLVPTAQADLLDLPWMEPLADWQSERLVEVERGIGQHVVRFVDYDGDLFALKELPPPLAAREYRLLRGLATEGLPAVHAVGMVNDRPDELPAVLITRYLDFSLPFRLVIARRPVADFLDRLLDALVELLVRLHLAGFYWGDCSLSNTLFRRDAAALAAYLVDAETSERHPSLSDGQRLYDLDIAEQNAFGELLDLEEQLGSAPERDPATLSTEIRSRYERLWSEVTGEEEFGAGERHRLRERLDRLQELGFDAEEVELTSTDHGFRLRVDPQLVEPGHHRRRLLRLTGLDAQENQARRLLEDVTAFRQALEEGGQQPVSDAAAAGRWLAEVFEPAVAAVPAELRAKRQAAQLFHELVNHRWYLSEQQGREVGMDETVRSYTDKVLREMPDERTTILPRD